jgi:transcriptional regulator NrdR family protein
MSVTKERIPRTKMSAQERGSRSRLAQLIGQRGVLRGTLLRRRRVCGKANCRCTRGHKHESLYLVISEGGRTRQLYVPKEWESPVRQWVENYHQAKDLLESLSRIYWDKVRQRRD